MKKILGVVIPSIFFLVLIAIAQTLLDSPRRISLPSPEKAAPSPTMSPVEKSPFIVGIAPQHSVAEDHFETFYQNMEQIIEPELIIVISPNHWGDGFWPIMLPEGETLGSSPLATTQISALASHHPNAGFDSQVFAAEHGITIHLPYLKQHFSNAEVMPLIIDDAVSVQDQEELIVLLKNISLQQSTLIIGSIDFSHYLPKELADIHDITVLKEIDSQDQFDFSGYDLDCANCLSIIKKLAVEQNLTHFELLLSGNSTEYLKNSDPNETTSYITGYFSNTPATTNLPEATTFLFGGDVMLGRYVEELMNKNGYDYPIQEIWRVFRGFDHTHINFEGPIPKEHVPTPNGSTRFSFTPQSITTLRMLGVDSVSLANNHTADFGQDSYFNTISLLEQNQIEAIGHPGNDASFSAEVVEVAGSQYGFVGLHVTNTFFDETAGVSKVTQLSELGLPVFVTVHWGHEYQPLSHHTQQTLAHNLIDAGANMVIGHHPHVVQEVEIYRDAPIFYSLGNLIFDQYFSVETQEGLLVSVVDYENKMEIKLWPIESSQSQPKLMDIQKRRIWLEAFAERHPESRQAEIKAGTLTVPK